MAAQTFTATFAATDSAAVVFIGVTATVPDVIPGGAINTTAGAGPVDVYVDGAPTATGCTVKATAPFTGTVNLIVIG